MLLAPVLVSRMLHSAARQITTDLLTAHGVEHEPKM